MTADTRRLVEGDVEVTPLRPGPVKGLPEPIDVYELVRAGPARIDRLPPEDKRLPQAEAALAQTG